MDLGDIIALYFGLFIWYALGYYLALCTKLKNQQIEIDVCAQWTYEKKVTSFSIIKIKDYLFKI
jgi:hypothetical protein